MLPEKGYWYPHREEFKDVPNKSCEQSQTSSDFIKEKEKSTTPKIVGVGGPGEKGNCAREQRSLGFYSNEGVKYSSFRVALDMFPGGPLGPLLPFRRWDPLVFTWPFSELSW